MDSKRCKLYRKLGDDSKKVYAIDYSTNEEYYDFLRKCNASGYRQIIISSELMVLLLKKAILNDGLQAYEIEFQEDDDQLQDEINSILSQIPKNELLFAELLEKLRCLTEKSSIDIKRIRLKGRIKKGVAVEYYVQSNGIVGVNSDAYEVISSEIRSFVANGIF